jgi:hypothetical protein
MTTTSRAVCLNRISMIHLMIGPFRFLEWFLFQNTGKNQKLSPVSD